MTLSKALVPSQSFLTRAVMVLGGSLFIALAAQISVGFPVPMTLQTLAILIVGLTYGARMGALTLVAYLAEGAMGLPVFANGLSASALVGPTAGFLYGFVMMAWIAGYAADRGARGFLMMVVTALVASALLYVPGLAWPALVMGKTVPELLSGWMLPFLAGDAVKAVMAALVVSGGWAALKSRKA